MTVNQENKTLNGIRLIKIGDGWYTEDGLFAIDIEKVGLPLPKMLAGLAKHAPTPEIFIQRIQIGLGVRNAKGEQLPMPVTPEGCITIEAKKSYKAYSDALSWLHNNYPGGWFYAAAKVWRSFNPNVSEDERYRRNRQYLERG